MLVAVLSMLIANRALPEDLARRADWERAAFWSAWALSFAPRRVAQRGLAHGAHVGRVARAICRHRRTRRHCRHADWLTTGDHLLKTIGARYWPVAGFDLALLATGTIAATAAIVLRRRERRAASSQRRGDEAGASEREAVNA